MRDELIKYKNHLYRLKRKKTVINTYLGKKKKTLHI